MPRDTGFSRHKQRGKQRSGADGQTVVSPSGRTKDTSQRNCDLDLVSEMLTTLVSQMRTPFTPPDPRKLFLPSQPPSRKGAQGTPLLWVPAVFGGEDSQSRANSCYFLFSVCRFICSIKPWLWFSRDAQGHFILPVYLGSHSSS